MKKGLIILVAFLLLGCSSTSPQEPDLEEDTIDNVVQYDLSLLNSTPRIKRAILT